VNLQIVLLPGPGPGEDFAITTPSLPAASVHGEPTGMGGLGA